MKFLIYAKEILNEVIKEEYPDLTDTQILLFNHYAYGCKLDGLIRMIQSGGSMSREDHFKDLIRKGLENFVYDQSEEVIEIIKKMGDSLDHNFDTLKSMLKIKETDSKKEQENQEICKKCFEQTGCTCCMCFSCEITLDDIKEEYQNLEGIKKLLDTGLVVIDKWEESEELWESYYLRLKNVYDGDLKVNYSYGGCCILLGKDGCRFDYGTRPCVGRSVVPINGREQCIAKNSEGINSKLESAISFQFLQVELQKIVNQV